MFKNFTKLTAVAALLGTMALPAFAGNGFNGGMHYSNGGTVNRVYTTHVYSNGVSNMQMNNNMMHANVVQNKVVKYSNGPTVVQTRIINNNNGIVKTTIIKSGNTQVYKVNSVQKMAPNMVVCKPQKICRSGNCVVWWDYCHPRCHDYCWDTCYTWGSCDCEPVTTVVNYPVIEETPVIKRRNIIVRGAEGAQVAEGGIVSQNEANTEEREIAPTPGDNDGPPVRLPRGIDLAIEDIKVINVGDPANNVGPTFRVTVRNNGSEAASKFQLGLFASLNDKPSDGMVSGGADIEELAGGSAQEVDVQMPLDVLKMKTAEGARGEAFKFLFAVADPANKVNEIEKKNNVKAMARESIQMIEQAPQAQEAPQTQNAPETQDAPEAQNN